MWIKSNHPWSFKSGQWLVLVGLDTTRDRVCFRVFDPKTMKFGSLPCDDPSLYGQIEFSVPVPRELARKCWRCDTDTDTTGKCLGGCS